MKDVAPERGGSFEIFDRRPIRQKILAYCVQDVVYLPSLFDKYNAKLRNAFCLDTVRSITLGANGSQKIWAYRVTEESTERVALSQ